MKARLFFSVVAMLLLASCTEDTYFELKDEYRPAEKAVFSAFMENYKKTRTGISTYPISGYYSLFWTRGDAISIYDGRNTAVFTTENDNSSFAEFVLAEGQIDDDASEYKAFYPSTITVYNQTVKQEDIAWEKLTTLPLYAVNRAKERSAHYPTQIGRFKNGVAEVRWELNPDGYYFMDDDGFGMTDDEEITIYGLIDRRGAVVAKFQPVNDSKEWAVMKEQAEKRVKENKKY